MVIPTSFFLTRYEITIQALETIRLGPVKSSALRGGFGHSFKQKTCLNYSECKDKEYCPIGNGCPYGYVFETSPPPDSEALRSFSDVPRPFIFETAIDNKLTFRPGEKLTFDLILIGRANTYCQRFFDTFRLMGEQRGLGKTRGKYTLLSMDPLASYDTATISEYVGTLSPTQIRLEFITPTQLKHRGRLLTQMPEFDVLVNKLVSRLSSLSYFHCGERLEIDFRNYIDEAANVRIVDHRFSSKEWSRRSGRQNQRVDMGGVVGEVTYRGDLTDYLSLLALGELVHVGKGAVFGNGHYQISPPIIEEQHVRKREYSETHFQP
jgi:hypothetical protein